MVSATCRYSVMCWPPGYSKCPSRSPPVCRRSATTSCCVGTSSIERCLNLVRAPANQDRGNGPQNNFPVQRERPVVDVLHVEFHPGLEVDFVAPADGPQACHARPHPQTAALPPLILFHLRGN